MTRGRRALLLLGLALLLGTLAASDVAGREAELRQALSPVVEVVVARKDIRAGSRLAREQLAIRKVPARYAPAVAITDPGEVAGARAVVPIPAGSDIAPMLFLGEEGAVSLRPGETVVELVATGSPRMISAGARVDVLVSREQGGTKVALENAEVLTSSPAPELAESAGARVAATLKVTVRQALYLTAAQSYAREIRLLPRSPAEAGAEDEPSAREDG